MESVGLSPASPSSTPNSRLETFLRLAPAWIPGLSIAKRAGHDSLNLLSWKILLPVLPFLGTGRHVTTWQMAQDAELGSFLPQFPWALPL